MKYLSSLIMLLILASCKDNRPVYYKNIDTGEILSQAEFHKRGKELFTYYSDSTHAPKINYTLMDKFESPDSVVQMYFLDIKAGSNHLVISSRNKKSYEHINKNLPSGVLLSIDNNRVNVKDFKGRPTLINFWFTKCKPCVAEMPVLNKLRSKYTDKMNFVSITFNDKEEVAQFLKKREFNFDHFVGADDYIDKLGIDGFPKNIFIDKDGVVKYIEGGISNIYKNGKSELGNGKESEKYIIELM